MFSCDLMPRPTATIRSACDRSTACLASWNGASGFWRIVDGVDGDARRRHGRGAMPPSPRRRRGRRRSGSSRGAAPAPCGHDVGHELALEHRARERGGAVHRADGRDVGDEGAVEARGQRGREVARLVGVRQQHVRRRPARRSPAAAPARTRRACRRRARRPPRRPLRPRRPAPVPRPRRRRPVPATTTFTGAPRGHLLRGGDRFPAGAIELAVLLFGDDENHRTRASSRRRRTNSLAASAGEPPIITVCFDFCGA